MLKIAIFAILIGGATWLTLAQEPVDDQDDPIINSVNQEKQESANNYGRGPDPAWQYEILKHFFAGGDTGFTSETGWIVTFRKTLEMSGDWFVSVYEIEETAPTDRPKGSSLSEKYYWKLVFSGPPYSVNLESCESPGVCKRDGTPDKKVVRERLSQWYETDKDGNLQKHENIRTWGMWRAQEEGRLDGLGFCSIAEPGWATFFDAVKRQDCYQDGERTTFTIPSVSGTDRDADKDLVDPITIK